ncbi:MAG TPA: hypothetical protein VMG10_31685 [Gemmataceae bacterium]|nr:hypothetical protein [Gemmataceae bacterium]
MASGKDNNVEQIWAEIEELFARGDAAFVDQLRRFHYADILGGFAARWFADRRPQARQMLRDYLSRPLNAYRHEALVKRLFKMAEAANDDEMMAHFLVLFDRSLRRVKRKKYHWESRTVDDRATAEALLSQWERAGTETSGMWEGAGRFYVHCRLSEEVIVLPRNTTMPRSIPQWWWERLSPEITPQMRDRLENFRLFSVHTRNYLRRRAWRYFRKLGKEHPQQYVKAVTAALKLYEDTDVEDGLALLDNWGLMHALFHHSPALVAKPHGWTLAEGHSLVELRPAPMYESLWQASPRAMFDLLREARCRPVRQWAIHGIRRDPARMRDAVSLDEWLGLLFHDDSEVATLAAEWLRDASGLDRLSMERWLSLLETPNALALEILCELIVAHVHAERISLEDAVRLACSRPLPLARLGFSWLQTKRLESAADCQALLRLAGAEAEPLRPEMLRWARDELSQSPHFQPEWLLDFLDSRHADVRTEGWNWLEREPRVRENVTLWQQLLESPYDDVRLRLAAALEEQVRGRKPAVDRDKLDVELLRFLWASVLLNIHRGGRTKPLVVTQMVRRLEQRPDEVKMLLPILAVALRSVRGPEWRAGLAGVVGLIQRRPDLAAVVHQVFPELRCS